MDPSVFVDLDAQPWMVFGSHAGGVFVTALDPDTGRLAARPDDPWCDSGDDERFTHVASSGEVAEENTIEAPYIFAHDDWYYLLVNLRRIGQWHRQARAAHAHLGERMAGGRGRGRAVSLHSRRACTGRGAFPCLPGRVTRYGGTAIG